MKRKLTEILFIMVVSLLAVTVMSFGVCAAEPSDSDRLSYVTVNVTDYGELKAALETTYTDTYNKVIVLKKNIYVTNHNDSLTTEITYPGNICLDLCGCQISVKSNRTKYLFSVKNTGVATNFTIMNSDSSGSGTVIFNSTVSGSALLHCENPLSEVSIQGASTFKSGRFQSQKITLSKNTSGNEFSGAAGFHSAIIIDKAKKVDINGAIINNKSKSGYVLSCNSSVDTVSISGSVLNLSNDSNYSANVNFASAPGSLKLHNVSINMQKGSSFVCKEKSFTYADVTNDGVGYVYIKQGNESFDSLKASSVINGKKDINILNSCCGKSDTQKFIDTECGFYGHRDYCLKCGTTISVAPHIISSTPTYPAITASCTGTGRTAGYKCTGCKYFIGYMLTPGDSTQHTYLLTNEAVEVSPGRHSFKCSGYSQCGTLGAIITYTTANGTVTQVHEEGASLTCDYNRTYISKYANCMQEGEKVTACTVCGSKKTEVIPKTDHTIMTADAIAPTCTKAGLTEGKKCSVCGEILKKQEIIVALGHSFDKGRVTKEADCNAEGVKTYTCVNCGTTKTESLPKTLHNYDAGKITTPATCSSYGVKTYTCSICGSKKNETLPRTGHQYDLGEITKEATCKSEGVLTFTCNNCGDKKTQSLPKTDHRYNQGEITKEPSYVSAGIVTYTCSICGNTENDTTEKLVLGKTSKIKVSDKTSSSMKLSWAKVDGATGYRVYQKIDGDWKRIKSTTATSYEVKKLNSATTYNFRIQAYVKQEGETVFSDSKTTYKPTTLPENVKTLKVTERGTTSITFKWSEVEGATGYKLYRKVDGKWKKVKTTSSLTCKVTGLKAGTKYTFAVKAYVKPNDTAIWCDEYTVLSTATRCSKPTLTLSSKSAGKAVAKWSDVSGETGYQLYYSTSKDGKYTKLTSTDELKYTKSKLKSGKTYYFKVRAYTKTESGTVYSYFSTIKSVKIK